MLFFGFIWGFTMVALACAGIYLTGEAIERDKKMIDYLKDPRTIAGLIYLLLSFVIALGPMALLM